MRKTLFGVPGKAGLIAVGVLAALPTSAGPSIAAPPPTGPGDVSPMVVGGSPAAKGEFPWMVRLITGAALLPIAKAKDHDTGTFTIAGWG